MKRFGLVLISSLAVAGIGCSSSSDADGGTDGSHPIDLGGDTAIMYDAGPDTGSGDAGHDANVDMHVAACGDGHLDPGEQCDDGNTTSGDGCSATCHREAYCGDGHVDPGEECDDGENFACDGCSPNCHVEMCGNGFVDCGEICDGTPGCSSTCTSVTTCGNMVVDAPFEQCDPTITTMPASYDGDGCNADCLLAQDMVVDTLALSETDGCDFSGDGVVDNAFGTALGPGTTFLNMQIANALSMGQAIILLSMDGLNDLTATADPDVRLAWLQGIDADMDASNNLHGMGQFYAAMASFDMTGTPNTTFTAGIMSHMLSGGPEDVSINLGAGIPIPLTLRQAHIRGTLAASMMSVTDFSSGVLCGAIPVPTIAALPNFLDMIGGGMPLPPCDSTVASATLADVILGGAMVFILTIPPTQPDVDLDHDGLEHYEITGTADGTCQPVVTACIDGDGTRIPGHDCTADHRMADGWSAGLDLTAVHATILGIM